MDPTKQPHSFTGHARATLEALFDRRLKVKLLLRGGFEISGYAHVLWDWVEVYKERPGPGKELPTAFAHLSLDDIVAFEQIEARDAHP
jgi:hypothetical protein